MKKTDYGYGLDQKIGGKSMNEYLAELAEKNERQEIEIERGKLAVGIANAMTKHSRACQDAVALDAKLARKEAEEADLRAQLAEAKLALEKSKQSRKK